MRNEAMEIREAIYAGEQALKSLELAQAKLNSARNWGFADLLGGGFIVDMIKHSKMNDAIRLMEQAKRDLHTFQRELRDVNAYANLSLDIGGFLSFADFFFDGIVADYLVQSRIANAREQVNDAIYMVKNILTRLKCQ